MEKKINESLMVLWDKVLSISNEYADIKEIVINDYNFELAEDSFKAIKMIHNAGKFYDMIKFNYFINGLNFNNISDNELTKLIGYLDNQEKVEFVNSTLKKIVNSNSKKCCYLMGLLYNEITDKNRMINQVDIALINALGILNDFDINNFYRLLTIHYKNKKKGNGLKYIAISTIEKKYAKELNISFDELSITTEICDKCQIFFREADSELSIDEDDVSLSSLDYDEYYKITIIGERLYGLIKKIETLNNMEILI